MTEVARSHGAGVVYENLERPGSGYLLMFGDNSCEILVRKADPPEEKAFTIAHELGHLVLDISNGPLVEQPGGGWRFSEWSQEKEDRCDQYAKDLLSEVEEYLTPTKQASLDGW